MNLLPINPLLSPDGNLVSLGSLRGSLNATPIVLDAGMTVGNVSMSSQQISVSMAAKLGVGSIFTSSIQANETGFWMDAMAFADSATKVNASNIVTQTRWGYGLRILCKARQLDTNFSLNFDILGAAADLGLASISYEVQTIGLGATALATVLDGLSQFGALNGNTFHDLNTTVVQNLSKLLENPPSPFSPRPLAVQLSVPVELDPVVKARSQVFAIRRIREDLSLKDALARAAGKYDAGAVRRVYQQVAPGIRDDEPPGADAQSFAKRWMG